jgi:pilus assembly protein FimV
VRPAKPPAQQVAAPPPSLLNEIIVEPIYLAGGTVALLGLGGIGYMLVRRRMKSSNTGQDMEVIDNTRTRIAAPIVPSPDTGDFTNTASDASISTTKPDSVDPISEANLFLDFGRNEQAEETLKDALKKDPGNQQILLKLLSIYANQNNTQIFSDVARQLKDSGDQAAWEQVAEMGRKLEPGNPMYGSDDITEATEDFQDEKTIVQPAASLDFDLDFGAQEAGNATLDVPLEMSTTAPSGLDFDLGFIVPEEVAPAVVEHESPVGLPKST